MISITSMIKGAGPSVQIRNFENSPRWENQARVDRAKTLDGGGLLTFYAATDFDRDLVIECRLTEAERENIKYLLMNGISVRIAYSDGCFSGLLYRGTIQRDGSARLTFIFSEKISS
jgi:hypothetical protein